MGKLTDGKWTTTWYQPDEKGAFQRPKTVFRDWVTTDGSTRFAPVAGRYHLYVAYACPWAHRTLLARKLRGLEDVVDVSCVHPFMGEHGWSFDASMAGCTVDRVLGKDHLHEVWALFQRLDELEELLDRQRYLCGSTFTAADVCLWTTLFRFDLVYHTHFSCNLRRLRDYPNLWNYTLEVYQMPGVSETLNAEQTKLHYYRSHETIRPKRIVPIGPEIDYDAPHDRGRLD